MGLIYSLIVHEMMNCSLVLLSMNFFNCLLLNVIVTCLTILLIPSSLNLEKLCISTSPYSSLDPIVHLFAIVVVSFTLNYIMCPIVTASCGRYCHNPSLGLMIKARAYKGVVQEWNMWVTFHAPKSVGECEGMNPHIPKWSPTLGNWSFNGLWNLQKVITRVKFIGLKSYLYYWKALGT
jgi:hypothetical protein